MVANDFIRFQSEHLPKHRELQEKLDAVRDPRQRIQAMIAAGREAGFEFSALEAEAGLEASELRIRAADAELSEAQLEPVAGGLALQEATQGQTRNR